MIQSLQHQVANLFCDQGNLRLHHPTHEILAVVGWTSVHQLCAFTVIQLTLRIVKTGKPVFLANRLEKLPESRARHNQLRVPKSRINISFEGFTSQATRLYNQLPDVIKEEQSAYKVKVIIW